MGYGRTRASSVLDGFTLNPLPYPVLLILALIFILLGLSWYFSCKEVVETAEKQLGWILFSTPVVLILIVIINEKFRLVPLCFVTRGKARRENSPSPFRRELSMGCGCFDPGVSDNGAISIQLSW